MVEIRDRRKKVNLSEIDNEGEIAEQIYISLYSWKQECKSFFKSESVEDIDWFPVLSFILGTVTAGFLKQIGSEIWENFKKIFLSSNCKERKPNFEFCFNYQGIKVIAKVNSNDVEMIRLALENLENILKELEEREKLTEVEFIWSVQESWRIKEIS